MKISKRIKKIRKHLAAIEASAEYPNMRPVFAPTGASAMYPEDVSAQLTSMLIHGNTVSPNPKVAPGTPHFILSELDQNKLRELLHSSGNLRQFSSEDSESLRILLSMAQDFRVQIEGLRAEMYPNASPEEKPGQTKTLEDEIFFDIAQYFVHRNKG